MKKWGKRQMSYEYLWIQSQVSRKPCWKPGGFPLRNLPGPGSTHWHHDISDCHPRARFFLNVCEWTRRTCGWWDHAEGPFQSGKAARRFDPDPSYPRAEIKIRGAQKCDVPLRDCRASDWVSSFDLSFDVPTSGIAMRW
jgi:hypothetical protein